MTPGLPTGAVKTQNPAVLPRQIFSSHRAGNGRLGSNIIVVEIIERNRTNDNRQWRRRLAVVRHVNALARDSIGLILFGIAMTFIVNKRAGNTQLDATARVDIDPAVARHHALARQAKSRMVCLIPKALLHGVYRLVD